MGPLSISPAIRQKLAEKHRVSEREILQCFENLEGRCLDDTRAQHKTDPLSSWFVAQTNCGRSLKIIFVNINGTIHIKSAFEADEAAIAIYAKHGQL